MVGDEFFDISELPENMRNGIVSRKSFISISSDGESALFFPTCALKNMSVKEFLQKNKNDFRPEDVQVYIVYREEQGKVFFEKITVH